MCSWTVLNLAILPPRRRILTLVQDIDTAVSVASLPGRTDKNQGQEISMFLFPRVPCCIPGTTAVCPGRAINLCLPISGQASIVVGVCILEKQFLHVSL